MKDKAISFCLGFALGHKGSPWIVHAVYLLTIAILMGMLHYKQ